jgi:hypothetical protein
VSENKENEFDEIKHKDSTKMKGNESKRTEASLTVKSEEKITEFESIWDQLNEVKIKQNLLENKMMEVDYKFDTLEHKVSTKKKDNESKRTEASLTVKSEEKISEFESIWDQLNEVKIKQNLLENKVIELDNKFEISTTNLYARVKEIYNFFIEVNNNNNKSQFERHNYLEGEVKKVKDTNLRLLKIIADDNTDAGKDYSNEKEFPSSQIHSEFLKIRYDWEGFLRNNIDKKTSSELKTEYEKFYGNVAIKLFQVINKQSSTDIDAIITCVVTKKVFLNSEDSIRKDLKYIACKVENLLNKCKESKYEIKFLIPNENDPINNNLHEIRGNLVNNINLNEQKIDFCAFPGVVSITKGKYSSEKTETIQLKALVYVKQQMYEQAVKIEREKDDRLNEGNQLRNLDLVYSDSSEPKKSIEEYEQALIVAREISDRRNEGNQLGNLGLAYSDLGDIKRAIDYYKQALIVAREIGDRRNEGNQLGNLGLAYSDLRDTKSAIELLKESLLIAESIGDQKLISLCEQKLKEMNTGVWGRFKSQFNL